MPLSTGTSGVDQNDAVFVYTPPVVTPAVKGNSVTYGSYQQINAGDSLPAAPVILQIAGGSGNSLSDDVVTYRSVTLTPL